MSALLQVQVAHYRDRYLSIIGGQGELNPDLKLETLYQIYHHENLDRAPQLMLPGQHCRLVFGPSLIRQPRDSLHDLLQEVSSQQQKKVVVSAEFGRKVSSGLCPVRPSIIMSPVTPLIRPRFTDRTSRSDLALVGEPHSGRTDECPACVIPCFAWAWYIPLRQYRALQL